MKIHCIIQARYGSTRLPGKVLERIGGAQLMSMVAQRCCLAKKAEKVIVAYHGERGFVTGYDGCSHFIVGSEEPAARFRKVLGCVPCDGFVRVCADSPFIDPEVIDDAAQAIIDGKDYFLAGKGLQHGNQAEGFNTQAFLKAEPNMQGDEREHLGLWFQRRDRLTVDTPADLERARLIVSRMTKPHTEYTAAECLELLRNG